MAWLGLTWHRVLKGFALLVGLIGHFLLLPPPKGSLFSFVLHQRTRRRRRRGKVALESPVFFRFQRSRSRFMLGCGVVGGDYQKTPSLPPFFSPRTSKTAIIASSCHYHSSSSYFAGDKKCSAGERGKALSAPFDGTKSFKVLPPPPFQATEVRKQPFPVFNSVEIEREVGRRFPVHDSFFPFPAEILCIHTHRWKRRRSGQACLLFLL